LLDAWLRSILWDSKLLGQDSGANTEESEENLLSIHRLKARIVMSDGSIKLVQGVREVFEISDGCTMDSATENITEKQGKIVLIGRNLTHHNLEDSLLNSLQPTQ
jgi:hypothetical protein